MSEIVLDLDGFAVEVVGRGADLDWLCEFYGVQPGHTDPRPLARIAQDEAPTDRGTARISLLRAVRDAHQGWLVANGYSIVHAAAVSYGDRVVLIAGPREAGKTTLLTYLVAHAGATYVTNDRCAVDPSGRAVAVPTMLSIRAGTFTLVPGLRPIPWRRGQRPRHLIAELVTEEDTTGGPASLSPAQFCVWLGAERVRRGRVVAIVFPTPEPGGPTVCELAPNLRAETLLGPPTTDHLSVHRYLCHVDDYRIDAAPALLESILQADFNDARDTMR